MDKTIPTTDVQQLAHALSNGEQITVVDIRSDESRGEWWIPNSVHIPKLRPRFVENPDLLKEYGVPEDKPIVLVCDRGNSSVTATQALMNQGIAASSLVGGMKAWSLAWNVAEVPTQTPSLRVLQFRRTGKGCLSYMIASGREAAIIDPSLETQAYVETARQNGWIIKSIFETHVHADHISRARALAQQTGAKLFMPMQDRTTFEYVPLEDLKEIDLGQVKIVAIETPGHTPESVCYKVGDVLITGDTLFTNTVGRPDLKSQNKEQAKARAHYLFDSIERLKKLDGNLTVLPCHTSQPIAFDGKPIMATLADVLESVPLLKMDEDAFVETVTAHLPETPPNHLAIIEMNEKGEYPDGDLTDYEAGANRCAVG